MQCTRIGPNFWHIIVPDSDLSAKAIRMPRPTERNRPRAIRGEDESWAVISWLTCQQCHEMKRADDFPPRSIRRAQYSLLFALPKLYARRTGRSVMCRCCTFRTFFSGNLPDGYTLRVRATTEYRHQGRVIAKVFSLTDSNYLGEYLALDAPTEMGVLGQIENWWNDADTSDGPDDMGYSDHEVSDAD